MTVRDARATERAATPMAATVQPRTATMRLERLLIGLLLVVLAITIVRTAWLSDDAYITFRTIDNAIHGYGLRWNVDERVQTFTHPLWLIVLTPVIALTGNPYLSAIGVSLALTAGVVWLLVRQSSTQPWAAAYGLSTLLLSRPFVDFSTGGLENALSHLLLALLMVGLARPPDPTRQARRAGLLLGLLGTTRIDLLVLAGPIVLGAIRRPRLLLTAALGLWPLLVWEAFSVVYYGVPFPNTAYAKLATGIPHRELLHQGFVYLLDSLNRDPITLFTIAVAIALPFAAPGRLVKAVSAALVLYLIYVLRIGGDFMSGRFLTAPLVVSVFALTSVSWPVSWPARLAPLACAIALGFSAQVPTLSGLLHERVIPEEAEWPQSGVVDERKYYYWRTSLVTAHGLRTHPDMQQISYEIEELERQHPTTVLKPTVGFVGYYIGPRRHIIDTLALGDPLLARLPSEPRWRIGHYERAVPDGYRESVATDSNRIVDPGVHALYDLIREATRGPLFTARRWKAIVRLNLVKLPLTEDELARLRTGGTGGS